MINLLKKIILIFSFLFIINFNIEKNLCFSEQTPDKKVETNSQAFLDYKEPQIIVPLSSKTIIFKMILSLIAVVFLIIGFLTIMKKVLGGTYASFGGKSMIKILDKSYIEPKKSICVIKILDRLLILGVHQGGFTTISEIQDPAFTETIKDSDETKDFFDYLNLETKTDLKSKNQDFLYKISRDFKSIKDKFLKIKK